jgi:hypothetical protein
MTWTWAYSGFSIEKVGDRQTDSDKEQAGAN